MAKSAAWCNAGSKDTLEATIKLRTKLGETDEPTEDNTAKRLSALTGGYLSKETIETFQPMLVPVSVSFLAGLLITVALEADMPGKPREPLRWRWPTWLRRKPDVATEPTRPPNVSPEPEMIEISPEPVAVVRLPAAPVLARPRLKLAISNKQPVGAIVDFLAEGVDIVEGARTEMTDAYLGYEAWCRNNERRAMLVAEFVDEMEEVRHPHRDQGRRSLPLQCATHPARRCWLAIGMAFALSYLASAVRRERQGPT